MLKGWPVFRRPLLLRKLLFWRCTILCTNKKGHDKREKICRGVRRGRSARTWLLMLSWKEIWPGSGVIIVLRRDSEERRAVLVFLHAFIIQTKDFHVHSGLGTINRQHKSVKPRGRAVYSRSDFAPAQQLILLEAFKLSESRPWHSYFLPADHFLHHISKYSQCPLRGLAVCPRSLTHTHMQPTR